MPDEARGRATRQQEAGWAFDARICAKISAPNPQEPANSSHSSSLQSYYTNQVLFKLYPKYCPDHNLPLTKSISTRNYSIRCPHPNCDHQQSRFSHTPLHHFKLPVWMFGWALHESQERYPQVLSASEIQRRLGIAKNSALLLKRRLQLLASDQMQKIKTLMHEELSTKFADTKLPHPSEDKHVSSVLGTRPVPQADSVVLYSASQRANQGRKRFKHTGQTASIYLSDKLGGHQRGTLVHTLSWKGGPIIYDSIPNNQAQTLRPLLDKYIPKDVPVFTDEGYKFYFRINKNHRMVNHNRKSSDPRYRWARNRWSINGVHNQVAEGNHRNLKYNFIAGYSYITPKYSQLYLTEYAFWKNLKYYGWDKLSVCRLPVTTAPTPTTPTTRVSSSAADLMPITTAASDMRTLPDNQTSSRSSARVSALKVQASSPEPQKPSRQSVDFSSLGGIPSRATLSGTEEQVFVKSDSSPGSNPVFRRIYDAENHNGEGATLRAAGSEVGILRSKLCEIPPSE